MFGISAEHLLILGIVLLIFGPRRLPELGNTLGKAIRNFKDSVSGVEEASFRKLGDAPANPRGGAEKIEHQTQASTAPAPGASSQSVGVADTVTTTQKSAELPGGQAAANLPPQHQPSPPV